MGLELGAMTPVFVLFFETSRLNSFLELIAATTRVTWSVWM